VKTFANLSLDSNPVHLSSEFASKTKFGKRIIHGFLSASLISGVAGTILPGPGSIYLRQANFFYMLTLFDIALLPDDFNNLIAINYSQDLQFKKPVFINDTVTTRIKCLSLKKRIAEFETNCYNQHGDLVIEGIYISTDLIRVYLRIFYGHKKGTKNFPKITHLKTAKYTRI